MRRDHWRQAGARFLRGFGSGRRVVEVGGELFGQDVGVVVVAEEFLEVFEEGDFLLAPRRVPASAASSRR